jgi:hypothetical protein
MAHPIAAANEQEGSNHERSDAEFGDQEHGLHGLNECSLAGQLRNV